MANKKGTEKGKIENPVITRHRERLVDYHSISDDEVELLSTMNTWATMFFSGGTFFLSMAFSLWSGLLIEGSPTEKGKTIAETMEWVFLVAWIILWGFAVFAICKKKKMIDRIKLQSGSFELPWWKQMVGHSN